MSESVIKAMGLTKNFGKKPAIDSLSIDISGEGLIGLIGRNGAGKTTFMKLVAGQLEVNQGKLEVFGQNPMDNLKVLSNTVYTYHNMQYDKHLKLQRILRNYSLMFPDFDFDFATRLLSYFNLNPKMKYKSLSQGMASIFNFICGLSCRARLTLLDEPVLGMDVTVRKSAYEILLREFSEHPRTIIISSHLLSELEGMLSDILLIDEGKLVLYKDIDELRQSAYRIEGEQSAVDDFSKGKQVISKKSGITSEAVIFESLDDNTIIHAKKFNLKISAVRPEDLCIYLTRENKEGELECLWQKAN